MTKKITIFDIIRNYLALGRTFGAMLTAVMAIMGALSSSAEVTWYHIFGLILVGICFHYVGCSFNEIRDKELDSKVPELKNKPLVSGIISLKSAWRFAIVSFILMILLSNIFFPCLICTLILIIGISFGIFYDFIGKYTPWLYEFTLGCAFFFFVIYGALITGGIKAITPLTWIVAIIIFFETNMSIWIAGLKDVETDRNTRVPTRAVVWNYSHDKLITVKDKNFIFGTFIKIAILFLFCIPFIYDSFYRPIFHVNVTYIYIFLFIGIFSQIFIIYNLLGCHNREQWTKMVVLDIAITWILAPLIVFDKIGLIGVFALFFGPIIWQSMFNFIIYGTISAPKL